MSKKEKYEKIKYLIIDVDGTLTDSGIYYDDNGNELKRFSTRDAAGFFAAHKVGMKIMILTGRECPATTRRMTEMRVDFLVQDCKDKVAYLEKFIKEEGLDKSQLGYIGDDLNDLPPMMLCAFKGCPKDACEEVKAVADYVAETKGGKGAVRDVINHILKVRGEWEKAYKDVYGIGI